MDQERGIRAACFLAFADKVRDRTCEAFYVRIEKELVQDERRKRVDAAKARFLVAKSQNAGLSDDEVKLLLIKEEIVNKRRIGNFGDAWVAMPLPALAKPEKAVCWLTAHDNFVNPDGTPDDDHVAWLMNKASLTPLWITEIFFILGGK